MRHSIKNNIFHKKNVKVIFNGNFIIKYIFMGYSLERLNPRPIQLLQVTRRKHVKNLQSVFTFNSNCSVGVVFFQFPYESMIFLLQNVIFFQSLKKKNRNKKNSESLPRLIRYYNSGIIREYHNMTQENQEPSIYIILF